MVMICQQCGDEGFTNAFIYCVKCLGFVIHRYCLHELPKTFDEFVCWYCEDCKPKPSYQPTFPSHNSLHTSEKDYASSVNGEEIYSREKLKTNRNTASLVDGVEKDGCQETTIEQSDSPVKVNLKKRKKRYTTYLVDETGEAKGNKVIRESDSEHVQLVDSPIKLDSKRKKTGNTASVLERTEENSCSESIGEPDRECGSFPLAPLIKQKKRTKLRNFLSLVDEAEDDSCHKLSTELEQECVPLAESCIREKIRKEMKRRLKKTTKEKETDLVDVKEKSSSQLVIGMENNTTCLVSETRDDRFQRSPNDPRHQFAKFVNNSQQDVNIEAQPVIDTIWTGSFDIANTDYEIYAVGHVSSKVCSKVFEEASSLPSMLSLEMLPKSDLWPKSFLENKPSDDNIALYLFPAAPKHEMIFDSLVKDMMNEELAMRAVLTNAELLIFTSEELPQKFWRFREKFYLWGVFRGKRVNPSPPPANNHLLNSKGSDRCDPHTNSSKKIESGKRTLQDSKGSDRSDPRTNSSNKVESGKRSQQNSKGSHPHINSSKKVESGKRIQQESKGSEKSNPGTNSSSEKWKENPHQDRNFGGRKEFSKSFKQ